LWPPKATLSSQDETVISLQSNAAAPPGDHLLRLLGRNRHKQGETNLKLRILGTPPLFASLQPTVDTVAIIESRKIREELPLIPRVFFAKNSSTLAQSRYDLLPETQSAKFYQGVREINSAYRNLLNIIADRLRSHPGAVITLRGFSPGPPVETNALEISRRRAQYVHDHLVTVLSVDPRQVREQMGKPEIAEASTHDPLRLEELQRVDLEVSPALEETIFAPIVSEKKEIDALPGQCGFVVTDLQPGSGLRSWRLTIMSHADTIEVLTGSTALPDTIWWNWQFDPERISDFWKDVRVSLRLVDGAGQEFSTPWVTIASKQTRTAATQIEKIPLILFAFDEYELDRTSARLRSKLRQIASKLALEPQASCMLYGYTDEIGEVEHNYQLSVKRAGNVLREMEQLGVARGRMSFQGFGESAQLADNRLPEGRMLNRRVEVHIRHAK
jgi:outer membrane protein OmpA-like peptidoglycan-associated protein